MEVFQVFSIYVGGCDVCATSKPPLAGNTIPLFCFKVPGNTQHVTPLPVIRLADVQHSNILIRLNDMYRTR